AVITRNETSAFKTWSAASGAGKTPAANVPNAAIQALTTSETSSKNPIDNTSANENNRSLINWITVRSPVAGDAGISQIVFSASRSSINTPEAPNSSVSKPMTVA